MTGLFDSEDSFEPSDDFVRGRVGRFVEVDYSGFDIRLQVSLQRADSLEL